METQKLIKVFLENPTQDNFDAIRQNYLALSLICDAMVENRQQFMTFFPPARDTEFWLNLYCVSFGSLKNEAFGVIDQYEAKTDWLAFYVCHSQDDLRKWALGKITALNYTFEEWKVYMQSLKTILRADHTLKAPLSPEDINAIENTFLSKMRWTATSFDHWESIYKYSHGPLKEEAIQKLKELL